MLTSGLGQQRLDLVKGSYEQLGILSKFEGVKSLVIPAESGKFPQAQGPYFVMSALLCKCVCF